MVKSLGYNKKGLVKVNCSSYVVGLFLEGQHIRKRNFVPKGCSYLRTKQFIRLRLPTQEKSFPLMISEVIANKYIIFYGFINIY